jgi:hypothetical protein
VAAAAGDNPRARCANLNFIERFVCMRQECANDKWRDLPECAKWRADGQPANPDLR